MSQKPVHGYLFGPRNRRGVFGTLRASQLLVICVVLVIVVGLLRQARGSTLGIGLSVLLVVALGTIFVPIEGRTLDRWVPIGARHLARAMTTANVAHSKIGVPPMGRRPPQVFSCFEIVDLAVEGSRLGVLIDRQHHTVSSVLAVEGSSFALLDDEEKVLRCAAWSDVLASLANSSNELYRVQWISRCVPDPSLELGERADKLSQMATLDHLHRARRSYQELVEQATSSAQRREDFIVLTTRDRFGLRRNVGPKNERGESAFVGEIASFARRCQGAGLAVNGALSHIGLSGMVRRLVEAAPVKGEVAWPWPNAVDTSWSQFRTDALFHATYWVAEWPRSQVRCDFLLPLLQGASERRSMSLVMAPIAPAQAARRLERHRTEDASDYELRRRHGFHLSARTEKEHDAVLRRETELAEGHGLYRLNGYVTVSARTLDELERACQRVEQLGALAHLELHRLYGDQAEAFCTALPAGRGCS